MRGVRSWASSCAFVRARGFCPRENARRLACVGRLALLVSAALCTCVGQGRAQVFQTDAAATPLPQPVGVAEWALVTQSWAFSSDTMVSRAADGSDVEPGYTFGDFYPTFEDGDAITLQGLFKWRGETIDPVQDARLAPGSFVPQTGFSVELVLRGGNCEVAFGWYNVSDEASTTPPAQDEIYELMPADVSQMLDCQPPLSGTGFCPLAWDNVNPRELDEELWTPVAVQVSGIVDDPRYTGGAIGFAVIGNAASVCSANKYSIQSQNQKNSQGEPWVTVLSYASKVNPGSFYLAFEDVPMSADDWQVTGIPGNNSRNNGDFNDLVYFISVDSPGGTGGSTSGDGTASGSGGAAGASDGGSGGDGAATGGSNSTGGENGGGGQLPESTASNTTSGNSSGGDTASVGGSASGGGETSSAAGAPGMACTPGRQLECTCSDGRRGAQACREDGDGFTPCVCSARATRDDGGCGCRLDGRHGGAVHGTAWLILLGCARLLRRRRRLAPG